MLKEDDNRQRKENEEALAAAADPDLRESYLSSQRLHVLKLASRILGRYLTESDDEWMIAMMGLNQALDTYDVGKGEFWPYAQVVIRSRLMDYTRSSARHAPEMSVGPDVLAGTDSAEEADPGLRREIASRTAVKDESELRDEIEALTEELGGLDISFFDLAECSPRAGKTRSKCAQLIRAIFLPPPLTGGDPAHGAAAGEGAEPAHKGEPQDCGKVQEIHPGLGRHSGRGLSGNS